MRARLPVSFRICSAYTNGYLHTSHCVYTARPIGTAYPAPNPGRDKDKALYCRPIACGRRLSVYVCPPCNRTPATGRCVAGKPTTITRTAQPWPFCRLPARGKSKAGRGDWVFLEGLPRVGFIILRYLLLKLRCGICFFAVRSVDLCSTLSHALRALAHPDQEFQAQWISKN